MNPQIKSIVNSPLNRAVCDLMDWAEKKELERNGHIHYECAFVVRDDKLFHVCNEQKTEWEIK